MPTTLIGIQEWYIACLHRNPFKGWRLNQSRALRALNSLGFTFEQSRAAIHDAFDMWELEKIVRG